LGGTTTAAAPAIAAIRIVVRIRAVGTVTTTPAITARTAGCSGR
jgi:hypothetical protein